MAIGSKVSGVFKTATGLHAKVDGGWKPAQKGFVKVFDTNTNISSWKLFWAAEIKDTFGRANTNNTLDNSEGGIAWSILRGAWRIQNNAANTTSAKTDYPLAIIDMGALDFELQANELSPGMGVVVRGFDANNWTAIYPYYNQTSYTYATCISGRNEIYCIANCTTPAGYSTVCYGTETAATTSTRQVTVPTGCVTIPGVRECAFAIPRSRTVTTCAPDTTETYRFCLRYCSGCRESCVAGPQICERDAGRTVCYPGPQTCTTTCSRICCDWDYATRVVPGACTTTTEYYDECVTYATGPSTTTCSGSETVTETYTIPATCSTGYVQVPYYNCCTRGSQFICEVAGTATAYSQFYYIRVATMLAGVLSYQDIEVTERWNALKVTGLGITLSINAYKDAGYTQLVKTTSVTNSTSATQYGIIGAPSIYEDGRDIGSIQVKAYGQ